MLNKIVILSIIIFLHCHQALSWPIPDSGQTISFTEEFGEDPDYIINPNSYTKLDSKGNALANNSSSWTMVRDNVTGLIWEVKSLDNNSINSRNDQYNWFDAQDVYIKKLNDNKFGGNTDWRLPTLKELGSIVNLGKDNPSINTFYFPNTGNSRKFWHPS